MMEVPFARPWFGGGEAEAVGRGGRVRLGDPGPAGARSSSGPSRIASALPTRWRPRTARPRSTWPCTRRRRPRRRGDRAVAVVHRDRQRRLAVRRDAGVRRHRSDAPTTSTPGRASERSRRGRRRSSRFTRSASPRTWTRSSTSPTATTLLLVEDAACAIGALHRGRPIGSLGPLACFSLHPRKVITMRRGRHDRRPRPRVAERLRRLRQHAMDRRPWPGMPLGTSSSSAIPNAGGTRG